MYYKDDFIYLYGSYIDINMNFSVKHQNTCSPSEKNGAPANTWGTTKNCHNDNALDVLGRAENWWIARSMFYCCKKFACFDRWFVNIFSKMSQRKSDELSIKNRLKKTPITQSPWNRLYSNVFPFLNIHFLWDWKDVLLTYLDAWCFRYPSSHNHGSVKNGCISNISFLSFRAVFHMGERVTCYPWTLTWVHNSLEVWFRSFSFLFMGDFFWWTSP